jgi:aryl-alcohol dehydrogenase-like predicted oxidoreductase
VGAIDLYQIHWPDPAEDIEEGWATLAALKQEGKVRHIGVSNFTVADLEIASAIAPVTSVQPPYSALRRDIEHDVLPWCQTHNVGVIVYSPMQSGLLTGAMTRERFAALAPNDWRRKAKYFQEPYFTQGLELVDRLRAVGEKHGKSPSEAAIAWTLKHPAVTAAIVGARRPEQLDGIVGAADFTLVPFTMLQRIRRATQSPRARRMLPRARRS